MHAFNALLSLSMVGIGIWGVIRITNWLEQRAVAATGGDGS